MDLFEIIPEDTISIKLFAKMLSISVADVVVILVWHVILGTKE